MNANLGRNIVSLGKAILVVGIILTIIFSILSAIHIKGTLFTVATDEETGDLICKDVSILEKCAAFLDIILYSSLGILSSFILSYIIQGFGSNVYNFNTLRVGLLKEEEELE